MYNYVIAIIVKEKIVRSVDQQLFHLKKIKMLNLLSHYNPIYTSFFSIVLTLFYNETQAKRPTKMRRNVLQLAQELLT